MAQIFARYRFNWHGFQFENAIKGLSNGYAATQLGLEDQLNRAAADVDDYDTRRNQNQLEPYEEDEIEETGRVILPYRDILLRRMDDLEDQSHDLRIAYSLMLYHQWERSARSWTKKADGGVDPLVESVKALGLPIDPLLEDLRLFVNVIKHNNDRWGQRLAAKRPDLFVDDVDATMKGMDWFSGLELTHKELLRFFDAVKASGPTASSERWDGDDFPY